MKGRHSLVYASDMKVRIEPSGTFKSPNVLARCGEQQFFDDRRDLLLNPSRIIEVFSPSKEAYDRGEKVAIYRRLASLRD